MGSKAFAEVLNRTDSMRTNLLAEKQQEIDTKTICVSETHAGTVQKEQRLADQMHLHTTIQRVEARINDLTGQIDRVADGINALNQSLTAAHGERVVQYKEFRKAVNGQEAHQKSLQQAIHVLKHFHRTGTIALPQVASRVPFTANQENSYWAEVDQESDDKGSRKPKLAQLASQTNWTKEENVWADVEAPKKQTSLVVSQVLRETSAPNEENSYWAEVDQSDDSVSAKQPTPPAPENKWAKLENVWADVDGPETNPASGLSSGRKRRGVLSILTLLVDKSEVLIEAVVQDEEKARKAYSTDLTLTQVSIEEKDHELITSQAARGDAAAQLDEVRIALEGVNTEIHEVTEFLAIVDRRCSNLLSNFGRRQETRTAEIDELARSKLELQAAQSDRATQGQVSKESGSSRSGR